MNRKRVDRIFQDLFARGKSSDEFEYACTLLRVRGVESAGWDTLEETEKFFRDMTSLLQTPLQLDTQTRIALMLYSHLTEVDAMYLVLANLLRVIKGERYSIDPFGHLYRPSKKPRIDQIPPSAKSVVDDLTKHAVAQCETELATLLRWFFNDAVRNAFFHSDYIIYGNEFRSREGWFLQKDGTYSPSLKIAELLEQVNRGLLFYQSFMNAYVRNVSSYTSDVRIQGRMGQNGEMIPIILKADKHGLHGFQSVGGFDQI